MPTLTFHRVTPTDGTGDATGRTAAEAVLNAYEHRLAVCRRTYGPFRRYSPSWLAAYPECGLTSWTDGDVETTPDSLLAETLDEPVVKITIEAATWRDVVNAYAALRDCRRTSAAREVRGLRRTINQGGRP